MDGRLSPALGGVLFDKDGTLLDFGQTWGRAAPAIVARIAGEDRQRRRRVAEAIGFDQGTGRFHLAAPFIAGSSDDYGPAVADAVGVPFDRAFAVHLDVICGEEGLATLTPIGDVAGLFGDLAARGLALGIATNASEAEARSQMSALRLAAHLPFIAGYDSGFGAKPAPGMVTAFATHLGVEPGRIAMVGDSRHDLMAGRRAGVVTIAVLTGFQGEAELGPLADHVLPSIADLPRLLDDLAIRSAAR